MTGDDACRRARALGLRIVGPAVRLTGGNLNHVFRVPVEGGTVVLKHAPPHIASAPDIPMDPGRLAHEVAGLSLARAVWGPGHAPEVLAVSEAEAVVVMEDLGEPPDLAACLTATPDAVELTALGRLVGALHAAPVPAGFANPDVQAVRHRVQYEQVPAMLASVGRAARLGEAAVALGQRLQEPGRVPVMGDLWPPSVRWRPEGWVVLDWELSHHGRALQDVAHLAAHLFLVDPARAAGWWRAFWEGYEATAPVWDAEEHRLARVHEASELLARTVGAFPMVGADDPRHARAVERAVALLEAS